MCRLFGFRSHLHSQVHQSLVHAENALVQQSEKHPDGWGLACYQGETPQLIKSVKTAVDDSLFHRVSGLVSSHTVVAHIRKATTGDLSFINTHPFQFGRWVFAHNGKIAGFESLRTLFLEHMDPALRGLILGDTDSEHIFYLILSHLGQRVDLHRHGTSLVDVQLAAQAALRLIRSWTGEFGVGDSRSPDSTFLSFIISDGRTLLAHHGGKELNYSTHKSRCSKRESCSRLDFSCENTTAHGYVNHLLVASEPWQGENVWKSLQCGQWIGVDGMMRLHHFEGP